jgi:CheY-like chemotaxis protein
MRKKIQILLVEDNPADVDLARETLTDSKLLPEIHVVADGMEAMAFLRKEGEYRGVPRPDLVLLDLNLPRKDGREVLAEVKTDPALRRIPVVILSSSQAERDVIESYDLHANAYVTKPLDWSGFGQLVKGIEEFWFSVVRYAAD